MKNVSALVFGFVLLVFAATVFQLAGIPYLQFGTAGYTLTWATLGLSLVAYGLAEQTNRQEA